MLRSSHIMGYRSTSVGRLFVVSWEGELTADDQESAVAHLRTMVKTSGARPVMIAIVSPTLGPPSAEVRRRGAAPLREALSLCAALEIVIGGEGLLASLQRTTARGLGLLHPDWRGRVHVNETVRDAIVHASTIVSLDVAASLAQLEKSGFASPARSRPVTAP